MKSRQIGAEADMIKYVQNNGKLIFCILLSSAAFLFSNGQWCIPVLSWIYPILFLYILQTYRSSKTVMVVFGIYAAGFVIQFEKVIGMDLWVCIIVAVLLGAVKIFPYLAWVKSKRDFKATFILPMAMVLLEYVICCIYPSLGGLGDAYTQYQNLYLLQIVTLTGIYGITFIMYWTAAVVIWLWNSRDHIFQIRKQTAVYCSVMGLVLLYGTFMYQWEDKGDESVRTAGVTVPVSHLLNEDEDVYAVFYTEDFNSENKEEAKRKLGETADELFRKTEREAQANAKIIFWSELNGAVLKEDEGELLQKASVMAREEEIYLIASLLVKTPYENLKENKVVVFDPQGQQVLEYYKFGRSMGELCQKGDGKLKSFDTEYGRIAPFICSDMAFTSEIRQAGRNNVDIIIVPASDWREMTSIALKTAVVRGVENGCNIIRHTNNGKSMVSDVRGNVTALTDYYLSDTKTIAAQVPTSGRFTVYPYIGDLFVCLCGLYLLGLIIKLY